MHLVEVLFREQTIIYGVSICIQSIDIEEKLSSIFEREKN